jgi:hypothetical protein
MFRAIFTTSIARTTPAQKPRGRNKIIFFPAADIGVDIGVFIITIQLQTFGPPGAASPRLWVGLRDPRHSRVYLTANAPAKKM